jgi:BirA family biotin operon repressor/biotin-[acetyl-CoA-carboxylase] ligase
MSIGAIVLKRAVVASTSDLAKELARDGAEEGLVVVADSQTEGKGRMGRTWSSPPGGLYFSVLLRPRLPASALLRFTILAAEPIAEAIEEGCGCPVGLKWPNDIVIKGKKIGGVLVETASRGPDIEFLVLGVGINLIADKEQIGVPGAGSIRDCCGHDIDAEGLLRSILEALDRFYLSFLAGQVDDEAYTRRSTVIGRPVEAVVGSQELRGKALYLDMDGALVIRTREGMVLRLDSVHDTSLRVTDEEGLDQAGDR